jgi:hypothetical protein
MHTSDPLHLRMLDDHMKFMVWDDYVFGKECGGLLTDTSQLVVYMLIFPYPMYPSIAFS